ncbi:aldehyde oxidase GLOX-like [Heracleum sosnowskyi]|uniref:Aldehyde oxidase GLOX-like n=1 Tax=Heracleum sosnowskyi TaxID=360622 RepID=A0AAD8HA00_9APIA|nr:aldehyde oxidase GLOX-like [Heracleum sosnowskyi]
MQRLLFFLFFAVACCCTSATSGGKWDLLLPSVGIVAMHMQLLHDNRVIIYDRTDFGTSNISLADNKCRMDPNELRLVKDCSAHSVEYDVASNSIRPLMVQTDVWCSSGAVTPDGRLVQAGGYNDGDHTVRIYTPCDDGSTCDWVEIPSGLIQRRWYATSHILPDGRQIIIGGRRQFNYEFYPKGASSTTYLLPFLVQTYEFPATENNLYPFVFLNVDGNLFIFANNRAILLDYTNDVVVKTYPEIPDGHPRNYPSTGSAVLLPLKNLQEETTEAEVLVCGGAPKGSFVNANASRIFDQALDTCARIKITDQDPQWVMEKMPLSRVMSDMILLPTGDVLIINGCSNGTAGYDNGRSPALNPVIYEPDNQTDSRFEIQNPATTPRMYHSSAILLADGRVLVGGSNPQYYYRFTGVMFPTDLSLESFSPSYLDPEFGYLRPTITSPVTQTMVGYGQQIPIQFMVPGEVNLDLVTVTMVAPSFNTHSFSMSQRLLVLGSGNVTLVGLHKYQIRVATPSSGNLAPSGFYMLFVVHQGIPSEAIWIQIQ